jgi:hypothetical protein
MVRSKAYQLVFAMLGLCATACVPAGDNSQGSSKQQITTSVTHGTNVNQSFTLGSVNTRSSPLAFDWTCTNSYESCAFQLTVTTNDMGPGVTDWANNNPTLASDQEFTLATAVLMMVDANGNNYLNPEFNASYASAVTPGMIDCQYGSGWACTTDTSPHVAAGSVPAGTNLTVLVFYEPLASFVDNDFVVDGGTPSIDVSQFTSSVDITTALSWQ